MTSAQLTDVLTERWPLLAVGATTLVGATLFRYLYKWSVISAIPLVGSEIGDREKRRMAYIMGGKRLYEEGYRKFKEGIFRVTTAKEWSTIIVSPRFLGELQRLPDDVISMQAALEDLVEAKHTKLTVENSLEIARVIKVDLTPALVRFNPTIAGEVAEAFRRELQIGDDWTEININQKLLRIIGMVSGRIFIGPELCHSEEYLDASINYTIEVMTAVQEIGRLKWFRDLRAPYLPSVKRLDQRIEQALAFLNPIINSRLESSKHDPGYEKPDDLLQWLLDSSAKLGKGEDVERIAKLQLGLSFAAIHTTTMATTNAFYNLAAMPEIIPELRQEIRDALAETGGIFTSQALQKMKKLDSFLRETSRVTPPGFASFHRKVLKTVTLSSGQVLPAGSTIEVSAVGVNLDEEIFPDSDKFDAFRYYRAREEGTKEKGARSAETVATNQFVSVNPNHLSFGYGRHACPGRFFAANEIKMILSNALLRYDLKNIDSEAGRIPNLEFGTMSTPDGSKSLLFRNIQI